MYRYKPTGEVFGFIRKAGAKGFVLETQRGDHILVSHNQMKRYFTAI